MTEKYNSLTPQSPRGGMVFGDPMVSIDLPLFIQQIKGERSWKDGKCNAVTIFKTNAMRLVLIALHEGAEMARHAADGTISVQVLEGSMLFSTDQQSVVLPKGQMVVLHEKIFHSVKAIDKTIFLLTVTKTAVESTATGQGDNFHKH